MYGKIFSSMFTGSMVGTGAMNFALMSYVIANMKPDKEVGTQVELNPKLLATILGETEKDVAGAIHFLCQPDTESRTDKEDGRRLVRLGQFDYQVVNGEKYRAIRDEEARREQNRNAKRRERANKSSKNLSDGVSMQAIVNRAVKNDAITKQDEATMRQKWGVKSPKKAPTTAAAEYDLDDAGDHAEGSEDGIVGIGGNHETQAPEA